MNLIKEDGMADDWFKDAIFYEVFVRAFADNNNDGIGDLAGLVSKLDGAPPAQPQ
jgi:maltose alpha-D-glucosyltransferase/alpha-amylase